VIPADAELALMRDVIAESGEFIPTYSIESAESVTIALLPWKDDMEKAKLLVYAAVRAARLKATRVRLASDIWLTHGTAGRVDALMVLDVFADGREAWTQVYRRVGEEIEWSEPELGNFEGPVVEFLDLPWIFSTESDEWLDEAMRDAPFDVREV
jgi:hypothetical protein